MNSLAVPDIENCYKAFTKLDYEGTGFIDKDYLKKAFRLINEKIPEEELMKMSFLLESTSQNGISYNEFLRLVAFWRTRQQSEDSDELVDAFVEFGGQPDKGGYIDPEKLVRVIKKDFNLTFNIESLVQDLDTSCSGAIEFYEFVCIFASRL